MFAPLGRIEAKYKDEVVVIGVHSGKFTAEKETRLIQSSVKLYGITHPVVNDHEYRIWQSYATRAWPSLFFVDPQGKVIGKHEGEVDFDALDRVVGAMIAQFDREGLIDRRPLHLKRDDDPATLLSFPGGVAVLPGQDLLLIADTGHHRLLLAEMDGQVRTVIGDGTPGLRDGDFATARFKRPQRVAVDGDVAYVADSQNHAIRRVDLATGQVSTLAGTGEKGMSRATGTANEVALRSPWDLLPVQGHLIMAMAGSHQIWAMNLAQGTIGPIAGTGAERLDDGPFDQATFSQPFGLALAGEHVFVADAESSAIRRLDMAQRQVTTLVGTGLFDWGDRNGVGDEVRLQHPSGLAFYDGLLYIADTYNHKIKRLDPITGRVETLELQGDVTLHEPTGLAAHAGELIVADTGNHAVRVIDLATGEVRTPPLRF